MPKENRVVLGSNEDLMSRELDAKNFNFIAFDTPPAEFRASVRVRYRQAEQPATVRVTGENTVHITFDEPQRAITKVRRSSSMTEMWLSAAERSAECETEEYL